MMYGCVGKGRNISHHCTATTAETTLKAVLISSLESVTQCMIEGYTLTNLTSQISVCTEQ